MQNIYIDIYILEYVRTSAEVFGFSLGGFPENPPKHHQVECHEVL